MRPFLILSCSNFLADDLAANEPYSALAAVYEGVMRDVPYAEWFAFIRQHWQVAGPLIDVFSGKGTIAAIARQNGLSAFSLDASRAMLRGSAGRCVQATALALPFVAGIAAACTATNCSINYLLSLSKLSDFFAECHRVLRPGGLLALDYCPPERAWALHNRKFEAPCAAVFFHTYDAEECLLTSRVAVQCESSNPETLRPAPPQVEIHSQRIYSQNEIVKCLADTGFAGITFTPNYGLPVPIGVSPIITVTAYAA